MDLAYWKSRCAAAEEALRRARSCIWMSPTRRAVLEVLADLRPGEGLTTREVSLQVGCSQQTAQVSLRRLERVGLVDRSAQRGCRFLPVKWSLGYMVVTQAAQADRGPGHRRTA